MLMLARAVLALVVLSMFVILLALGELLNTFAKGIS